MIWRRSIHCGGGECVEVAFIPERENLIMDSGWAKSTYSNTNGACVETTFTGDGEVLVRDTKDKGEGPTLRFPPAVWDAFIKGVKNGEMQHG